MGASIFCAPPPALAASDTDITALPIEQLMNIEVTSVSKKAQPLSEAPAAIYVITQDDIRRSGMTTLPELLRTVPGLDVAQVNGNTWAISSRGFNNRFADKLLVLIDGRSVYNITDSGVNWDVQNVLLGDVERIEVIRGPGGTLWGANAVNGVINIITKSAKDTQGLQLYAGAGGIEQPNMSARYGAQVGGSTYLRVYGQGFQRSPLETVTRTGAHDGWGGGQFGFRLDATPSGVDTLMVQGDVYVIDSDSQRGSTSLSPPTSAYPDTVEHNRGGHALVSWTRRFSAQSDMTLQAFYDRADRIRDPGEDERVETYDIDFQHRFQLAPRHQLIWGLGYRSVETGFDNTFTVSFLPPHRVSQLFSAFVQDEIALRDDLSLTVGSKFEHNSLTGFEYQPSARLLWQAAPNQTLWASVSRAIQTPGLNKLGFRANVAVIPGPLTTVIAIEGNPSFQSETVLSYEAGYRGQITPRVTLDLAAYYNRYGKLTTFEPQAPFLELTPSPPHLVVPIQFSNLMHGQTYGVEVSAKWQVTPYWRFSPSFTWFHARMGLDPASFAPDSPAQLEGSSPERQFQIRSQLDLPHHLELDGWVAYVDRLPARSVPSYTRLDLRLSWRPRPELELSIAGQNLLRRYHQEFDGEQQLIPSIIPRTVYAQIATRF